MLLTRLTSPFLRSRNLTLGTAVVPALGLGGPGPAAGLTRPSDIRDGAVTSAKVRNGSLKAKDFAVGELPHGAKGEQGEPGLPGNDGLDGMDGMDGMDG